MPNVKDLKKYRVWDHNEGKNERYIVHVNDDGSFTCVGSEYEEEYMNNKDYGTCRWNHWEEIPEKKSRPMTRNEVLKFVAKNCDKLLVRLNGSKWYLTTYFSYDLKIENYEYIYIDELDNNENPKKFEVEE